MEQRDSFIFYRSFFSAISELNARDKAATLLAVCDYALNGVEPNLSGVPAAMFMLMKPNLDANQRKYENGKKGGRPKAETAKNENQTTTKTKPNDNQNETKTKPNVNVNDNVNVNVDVNVDGKSEEAEASTQPAASLILNTGNEYPISEEQVQEWSGLYPCVDIMQELRAMRGWLIANPTRRKTKSGILNFVNTWLAKEQNKGKAKPNNPKQENGNIFLEMLEERRSQ